MSPLEDLAQPISTDMWIAIIIRTCRSRREWSLCDEVGDLCWFDCSCSAGHFARRSFGRRRENGCNTKRRSGTQCNNGERVRFWQLLVFVLLFIAD